MADKVAREDVVDSGMNTTELETPNGSGTVNTSSEEAQPIVEPNQSSNRFDSSFGQQYGDPSPIDCELRQSPREIQLDASDSGRSGSRSQTPESPLLSSYGNSSEPGSSEDTNSSAAKKKSPQAHSITSHMSPRVLKGAFKCPLMYSNVIGHRQKIRRLEDDKESRSNHPALVPAACSDKSNLSGIILTKRLVDLEKTLVLINDAERILRENKIEVVRSAQKKWMLAGR